MEFDNWLKTVEAPARTQTGEDAQPEEDVSGGGNEKPQHGTVRTRSYSPNNQPPVSAGELSDPWLQQETRESLSFRPSPKRSRSTNSVPGRKRLKFSDSVEFHETYRSSEEYHRPSDAYVRGRNAPPEGSEYMDTSGSGQTFLRFTQMKKVGAKWVELSEDDLEKKRKKSPGVATTQHELEAVEMVESDETAGDAAGRLEQNREAPPDARAARLARRAKGTCSRGPAQTTSMTSARNQGNKASRKEEEPILDEASTGMRKFSAPPVLDSLTAAVEEARPTADEDQGAGTGFGVGREDDMQNASNATIEKPSITTMRNDEMQKPESSHDKPHLNNLDMGAAAYQDASDEHEGRPVESTLQSVAAQNNIQTERTSEPSCTGCEDTYRTGCLDAGNAVAARLTCSPRLNSLDSTARSSKMTDKDEFSRRLLGHHGASASQVSGDVSNTTCNTRPEAWPGKFTPSEEIETTPKTSQAAADIRAAPASEAEQHPTEGTGVFAQSAKPPPLSLPPSPKEGPMTQFLEACHDRNRY